MFNYLPQTYFNMHLGEGLEERKQLGPRTTPSVYYMPSMDLGLMVQDLPVLFSGLSPTRVRLFGALCITAVLKGSIAYYPPYRAIYWTWMPGKYLLNYSLGKLSFQ